MLKKILVSIILVFSCLLSSIGYCQSGTTKEWEIQCNDIKEVNISVTLRPIKDSAYCYTFNTNSKVQLEYISHFLNKMEFVDDGKVIDGADIPIVNISFIKTDNTVEDCGFVSGRFYDDSNNKQYAVDSNEYGRFLNFVYALKTEKLDLPDEVTFEASEWAEDEVNEAIENGLVPAWNQIGYTNNITRLEVCQLVDNFLMIHGMKTDSSDISPFEDTSDPAVESLYSIGIINGKSESEFYPYDNVTREETAKILSGLCDAVGITSTEPGIKYVDTSEISDWAVNYVEHMSALGLFVGDDENKFNPKSNLTKEELIITLLRLNEKIG